MPSSHTLVSRERRQADRAIADWVLENEAKLDLPKEIRELLPKIRRQRAARGSGLGRVDNFFFLSCMMNEKLVWSESEIYERFGLTRAVMSAKRASAFKFCQDPAKRVWMSLDKNKREYRFLDVGPDVPIGYAGPLPIGYISGGVEARKNIKSKVLEDFENEEVE